MSRVVIFGSRGLRDRAALRHALEMLDLLYDVQPSVVLSGREPTGMDAEGEAWAAENGVPVEPHSADWVRFPKTGGMIRNVRMAHHCDAGVGVVVRGGTPGSKHMAKQLVGMGKPCYVVEVDAPAHVTGTAKSRP